MYKCVQFFFLNITILQFIDCQSEIIILKNNIISYPRETQG